MFAKKVSKGKRSTLKLLVFLKSNDHHVIALAIVSGANILVFDDRNLGKDFKRWKEIDHKSRCISHLDPPSKRDTKIINKELPQRAMKNLIDSARVKSRYCECHIRGGGC